MCRLPIDVEDHEDLFYAFDNGIVMNKLLLSIDKSVYKLTQVRHAFIKAIIWCICVLIQNGK